MINNAPVSVGDRVMITGYMDDPDPIPIGVKGTVDYVGSWTSELTEQIGVDWDNGRKLLLLSCDPYIVINRVK